MPEHVYHYTSLEALTGILKKEEIKGSTGISQQKSSLVFWGSRHDCMNDPQDYLFASQVVLPRIMKSIEHREDIAEGLKENNDAYPYIVSFSENEDDDSMWRHYNAEICLKIDTSYLSPWIEQKGVIKGFWGKCIYSKEQDIDEKFFESWRNSLQYIENIPSMARHACVYIKREAFKIEKEWRLYIFGETVPHVKANGDCYYTEQPQDIKVKYIRDNDIVFYKEFLIDARALKGIIINDTNYEHFHKVKKHIELLLMSRGFYPEDILIEQTNRYPLH